MFEEVALIDGQPLQRLPRRILGDVPRRDDGLFELLAKFLVQCGHSPYLSSVILSAAKNLPAAAFVGLPRCFAALSMTIEFSMALLLSMTPLLLARLRTMRSCANPHSDRATVD